jgi:heptosyltransferase-2
MIGPDHSHPDCPDRLGKGFMREITREIMREILVIRFGALGDLCVLGWALSRLADSCAPGTCRITVVTKAAFAPLLARMHGVDEVIALDGADISAVWRLSRQLKSQPWDVVVDAHNILRSRLLLAMLGRRPDARLAKDTAARLRFMAFGHESPRLNQRMVDRFDDLVATVAPGPLAPVTVPPLAHLCPEASATAQPVLGVAPGAQWDTKRWPEEHFANLVRMFRAEVGGAVQIFLGPREQGWYADSALARTEAADDQVQVVQVPKLPDVACRLAAVDLLVTNDSGLLHLAENTGTPVLAFYGPTVRQFGYFPLQEGSRVLETELSCRPCSRNGKRPCHRQDLACLAPITPATALAAVLDMLGKEATT